jgi:hypothetical protein
MLQTLASRALTLLYNGLPTYSNNDWHIFIKNVVLINLFILFHPSTRHNNKNPDTNLGLLPKPTGHSFYRPSRSAFLFCIYGHDSVVRSKCSIAILAGNVIFPCLLASQLRLIYSHVKKYSQNNRTLNQIKSNCIGHIHMVSKCYCECSEMLVFLVPTVQQYLTSGKRRLTLR